MIDRTHDSQNRLTEVGTLAKSHTANGELTSLTSGLVARYDAWGRLKWADNILVVVDYEYDALNRRIVRDYDDGHGGGNVRHDYHSAQWQVIEEREDGTAAGDTATQYVWSPVYVDALILRDTDANSDGDTTDAGDERIYVQHDANFNVTAIADAAGSVVERYLYDAYGLRTVLDADWTADLDGATDYAWYHSHQGGRLDPLTGLHHFRHRDYDATLMRWTRQDPLGFVDGASLYLAYLASPPNTTDAHGLEGNERRKRPSRPTREEKLEQWRKSMKREMLSALGSMCPDEDDEESCCSRDECLKQAKQLTDAVVDTLHIHRSNRRWDQNGGVLGNLANAAPQIANTVLGAFTGDYEAVPRGNMECFDWQMLIMNAVNPIQSSRPADENCFSVVTNQSGAVFQHNWVEVKTGGKTVILDPWGSGGRDIVVDKPGDRPQTSGSGSGRRRR